MNIKLFKKSAVSENRTICFLHNFFSQVCVFFSIYQAGFSRNFRENFNLIKGFIHKFEKKAVKMLSYFYP